MNKDSLIEYLKTSRDYAENQKIRNERYKPTYDYWYGESNAFGHVIFKIERGDFDA